MEIAKGIQETDYKKLQLTDLSSNDWNTAIYYLEKRLNERFVEPTEVLIKSEEIKPAFEKKFGFAILAIDCLLLETLQSFYEGVSDSSGQSKNLFVNFLCQRNSFKQFFITDSEATDFYKKFRCGLLHQAQTFGDTKIWSVGELIHNDGKYLIVNRDLFHEKIKEELNLYLKELRKKSNKDLLYKFKTKMNFICGL